MKFTSEDLMKAMGLSVGDRIKVEFAGRMCETYIVKIKDEGVYLQGDEDVSIDYLVNRNYEILPKPKRVGDLTCNYFKDCGNCPLRILFCDSQTNAKDTLYDILNRWNNEYVNFDQEIHDLLKARLDKEVE